MAEKTAYCTMADVQRHVKRVQFSDTSKVTAGDINSYISAVSGIVDAELRKLGVSLPIASTATISLEFLRNLVAFEVAAWAEQASFFGANKQESSHGEWLHKQHENLLLLMQQNPCVLSDVVTSTIRHMKSDTEDMNVDGTKEGDEIFTQKRIDDFRDDHKQLTPSEKTSTTESITGEIPRTRI
jgi:hypothetical protein